MYGENLTTTPGSCVTRTGMDRDGKITGDVKGRFDPERMSQPGKTFGCVAELVEFDTHTVEKG